MSLVGPRPCLSYETEYFAAAPLRALPRSARHHRPLAGNGTCARRLPRGARNGRGVRAELVDRPRSVTASPDPGGGPSAKEGDGLMTLLKQDGGRLEQDTVSANGAGAEDARVRVGVVGLGYWGPNLVRVIHESAAAEAAWMCDLRPEALDALGRRFPAVRQTQDLDEMLDGRERGCGCGGHSGVHAPRPGDARAERGQARIRREAAGFLVGSGRRSDPMRRTSAAWC